MVSIPSPCRFLLVLFSFTILKSEAVTYYFNQNKTNNEFMIYNRVNMNSSYANSPSTVYLSELRNNVNRGTNITNVTQTHPLLDPEWNYNWKNLTRRNLPSYIHKFFESLSDDAKGPIRILFNSVRQNSSMLSFNLNNTNHEIVSDVELHFYLNVEKSLFQKSLILRLYQVENFFNESSLVNPDSHKLINVIYVLQAENGWQVFKLSKTVKDWSKEKTNLTLLVTISRPNEEQFSLFKDTNRDIHRTFLILKPEKAENGISPANKNTITDGGCRRHNLIVDFAKLNWMKFIIAPSSYNAFNCYGRCHRSDNLPNHIKVTSFNPEIARKNLCCASTSYRPLPIMFYDQNGNVAIKIYEDMIIAACGCR